MADNAEHAAIVLGKPVSVTPELSLGHETVSLFINGEEVATGIGSAILGDPVRSVLWLNDKLRELGETLKAGQFVMSGSIIRQFPLSRGDRVEAKFMTLAPFGSRYAIDRFQDVFQANAITVPRL